MKARRMARQSDQVVGFDCGELKTTDVRIDGSSDHRREEQVAVATTEEKKQFLTPTELDISLGEREKKKSVGMKLLLCI